MVAPSGVSTPSQCCARVADGGPPSSASAARGASNPLPIALAEVASSDLRVIRRALIIV
jgi:hypothetical protein